LVKKPNIEIREYSAEELEARALKKKGAIKNLSSNIRKLRSKVNEDLKSDNEKDFLTALAIYTMLETSERVGNGASAENGHFGVTGFRKKHVKVSGSSVDFKYKGKSGVDHDKKINNSRLANNLATAIKNS
jgi:DNA topoisomerase-1